jgi:hypothetical protein
VGFENYRRESLGGNLWMNQAVERVMKRDRIGLLANKAGPVFEAEVADIVAKKRVHCARTCDKKAGPGKLAHDDLCSLKENSLAFSDRQIESAHNTKHQFIGVKIESLSRGRGEGWAFRRKLVGIDSSMNDMNLFGRDDAGGAVMSLCYG